ncbi:MAG: type I-E CRISPR-associated endoribonuclease Cas2e [Pyrinomonadaceae bacterium]
MVVFLLEKVPVSLRGEITRWMIELRPGVFVGNLSALVRDKLWEMICQKSRAGAATMLRSAANEQGYEILTHGETARKIRRFDGLQLVTVPHRK